MYGRSHTAVAGPDHYAALSKLAAYPFGIGMSKRYDA
jgi:hypothetical protein